MTSDAFWEDEPGWVLRGSSSGGGYLPYNELTSRVRIICDDDEAEQVVTAMRLAGCPVVDGGRRSG
ncbi:hypothetical protein [Dactylosporangium darangshiense]|uniref:DUF2007 domain-containing protein n=1 Tax=Dactylosporangium darangshiense TaxID=579108 RepID=A0ABP8CYN0_9ACTN